MDIILNSITKRSEAGAFDLSIVVGSEPAKNYRATYEVTAPKSKLFTIEPEVARRLDDLARERYGNPAKYVVELMGILGAFSRGDSIPQLPAKLGTTTFFQHVLNKQNDA
jgi:hypothetical protein